MTPSRSRIASFMERFSCRELRNVGHAVHFELQLVEEIEALAAYGRIFRHHHDAVEEGIHGRLEDREALEVFGVVALLELRRGLVRRLAQRMVEVVLHLLGERGAFDESRRLALLMRLAKDVRDALVRRREA